MPVRPRAARDYTLPGFIDLQVNGAFGIDVMTASAAALLELSRQLLDEGTTAWMPTVITAPVETIARCDQAIHAAMRHQRTAARSRLEAPGARILGMHLEGPFISPKRLGAHPPHNLLPRGKALESVLRLESLRLITLAPELDGALDAISRFRSRGVTVSLGHSDATYREAIAGLEAGATMLTHLFNAMPPLHHREPGLIGAAMHQPPPVAMVIADGVHVHPGVLRLALKLKTAFVTDRVAAAGAARPPATVFGQPAGATICDGRAVRTAGDKLIGSAITMLDAACMARDLGCDSSAIARLTSIEAAAAIGLRRPRDLAINPRADILLLDHNLKLKAVWLAGNQVR